MAYKITRTVTIHGQQRWIRANSEQEYAEKLLKLYAGDPAPAAATAGKHDFTTYATNWFEIYSRPNIATATASTYERQLRKYIIPHFDGMSVEDVTVDHVQLLFNRLDGVKASKYKVKTVLNMVLDMAVEDGLAKDINFTAGITPARFRPTVLTDIYDQTKDIKHTQAAAGHTTAAMTLKHYVNGRGNSNAVTATAIDRIYGSVPC